jgi:MFS family permease
MEPTTLLNQREGITRHHITILGMAWAGWLFDFYDLMLLSFLLVPIKRDLGLSNWELSFLLGTTLAATAIGGIVFGTLADRFGRKRILTWTLLTYSVGTFACGLAHGFWPFLLFRIVTGLGVGGEWATGQTLIGETFPARLRARYAAVMQTGAPLGILLASLVGSFLEPVFVSTFGAEWGWRACFLVSVLPAVLVVVIRKHMPESDVWESQRDREIPSTTGLLSELRSDRALRRLFLLGLVLALADMSAYWFTYTWMPKYLYDQLGFSLARSGIWMIVTQVAAFAGYLSYGFVADWKGRRWAYSIFSLIWALGLLGITWFWGAIGAVPWLPLVFMILVGLGTGNFSGYGPIFSELFPTRIRSSAMGTAFNLSRGVQFFTPLIITWITTLPLARGHGLGVGISVGAFFAVFTGLWVWLLPETRGTEITR